MKTYTVGDIFEHTPCYDPTRHFDPDKSYTLLDFLNHETCPDKDKIWVVTRFLSDKENRLFAVWCARRALSRVDNPGPIAVHAVDVAEKYARGEATEEELERARDGACYACYARYARYATHNTACRAAYWATHSLACTVAYHAAYHAAYWAADCSESERKAQIEYLKETVKGL